MPTLLKLYIKTFLITGIYFASFMAISDYVRGEYFSIGKYLVNTFGFGGPMSLTLVSLHNYNLRSKGVNEPSDDNLKVIQQTEFTSEMSRDEFITKLASYRKMSRMTLNKNEEVLKLKTGLTWKSWGETISIKISLISEGLFKYNVLSKPILPTTLVDYGKNFENIQMIKELAKKAD